MTVDHPASHILTTKGVTSEVRATGGDPLGHILLLDYDGGTPFNRLMDDCKDLPGLTGVFESSPSSWHVWNTTVRGMDETALAMLDRKADPMHASVGYRRGRWTLRFGSKNRVNAAGADDLAEEYKAAPEPMEWWVNATELPQSRAHVNLLAARFGTDAPAERAAERCPNQVGHAYRVEAYRTMTDELKDDLR